MREMTSAMLQTPRKPITEAARLTASSSARHCAQCGGKRSSCCDYIRQTSDIRHSCGRRFRPPSPSPTASIRTSIPSAAFSRIDRVGACCQFHLRHRGPGKDRRSSSSHAAHPSMATRATELRAGRRARLVTPRRHATFRSVGHHAGVNLVDEREAAIEILRQARSRHRQLSRPVPLNR